MAYIALTGVYVVAAFSALTGIWLTARWVVSVDKDGPATIVAPRRWEARWGPILIAVGCALGLVGNFTTIYLPPSPASDLVAPSSVTDECDNNDGLFGLCGAGQLH
jgi:hypothetical protein